MPNSTHHSSRLDAETADILVGYGARSSWPAGFQVYQKGEPADGFSVVLKGHVILRSRIRAGRSFIPAVVTAGESFGVEGLSPDSVYVTDAVSSDGAETLYVAGGRFRAFVRENPGAALTVIGHLLSERAVLLERLVLLASQNVEQRLVGSFHRLARDDDFIVSDGRLRIEVQHHRLLCEMVGATRESIALALGRLVDDGRIERDGTDFMIAPARFISHISPGDGNGKAFRKGADR
ncbi:MAG: Crp/Fnr family transcriptional regulator [Gemmatimonadaceae bacterium]